MSLFHRHQWETVNRTQLPSAFSQFGKGGEISDAPRWFFVVKLVLEQKCECGATRIREITNP